MGPVRIGFSLLLQREAKSNHRRSNVGFSFFSFHFQFKILQRELVEAFVSQSEDKTRASAKFVLHCIALLCTALYCTI